MSQAGCIPARCAHLSGQELGCRRSRQARPPERAEAQPVPAPSPEPPRRGLEEEPLFSAAQTGTPASPPVQAPGSGPLAALGRESDS